MAHIGEVDQRRLFAREAAPSMFVYCTERLHLSEPEAYLRIEAARTARRYPVVLDMLRDGRLHLSGIGKLAPHLTPENCDRLLARATHQSKRRITEILAELAPRPDVPPLVRKLPDPRPVPAPTAPVALSAENPTTPQLRPGGVGPAPPDPGAIASPLHRSVPRSSSRSHRRATRSNSPRARTSATSSSASAR